ncbi:MAG: hypothetical protein HY908_29685 [Myxococcales bacterium]|nr:hypothetical protein [Myxococcales bacterium]
MNVSLPQAPTSSPRRSLGALLGAVAVATLASACASRAVPFKDLDNAQVTVYRLQQAPAAQPAPAPGGIPGLPAIPGLTLPPEIAQMGQAACQNPQIVQMFPFLAPMCQGGAVGPTAPPPRLFRNTWMITAEQPIADKKLIGDMLDIFGDSGSFNSNRAPCFNPGFAVSFMAPNRQEPVDVVVSYSCNQAVGFGFQWPHKDSGFTNDTRDKLSKIYQNLWGQPAPMQGG